MPSARQSLTFRDVHDYVERECFATSSGRVGAEIEWLTLPADDPGADTDFETVEATVAALGALPGGSAVTYEPGGQLELSSQPQDTLDEACRRLTADEAAVKAALRARGVVLAGIGIDPIRKPPRVLHHPRYAAMESYFDESGTEGRRMMRRTAAIQVNVDSGTNATAQRRWRLAHALGPVLAATFANSPVLDGKVTGWASTRLATWWSMDRTRTSPSADGHPVDAWSDYLVNARVMFVRAREDWYEPLQSPMTFREWMDRGHPRGFPTAEDLAYHATTVFPPVRARGWLELRMIDALPDPWWRVAVATTTALLDDAEAADAAARACEQTRGMWVTAARCALEDRHLAKAARTCMAAAVEALPRCGSDAKTIEAAFLFADRYTFRGRTPADDVIDGWAAGKDRSLEHAWT